MFRVRCRTAEPPLNVLTLRLSARPCLQTLLPAGMESMAEEQESADQSAALGGALRAWLAASLLRLESNSSLAPRAAPETPAGGGATAHRVALFLRCMLLLLLVVDRNPGNLLAGCEGECAHRKVARSSIRSSSQRAVTMDERRPLVHAVADAFAITDLLAAVLGSLDCWDVPAAAVCCAWHRAWAASAGQRRGLRDPKVIDLPPIGHCLRMAMDSSGAMCVTGTNSRIDGGLSILITDENTHTLTTGEDINYTAGLALNTVRDSSLYVIRDRIYDFGEEDEEEDPEEPEVLESAAIRHLRLTDAELLAEYRDASVDNFKDVAFGPWQTLFAVCCSSSNFYEPRDKEWGKVVALDALTLVFRHEFGEAAFAEAPPSSIAVRAHSVFVSSSVRGLIHVFSLAGAPMREIRGAWHAAGCIRFVKDRLYLSEDHLESDRQPSNPAFKEARRIFVLTPGGEQLQIFRPELWQVPHRFVTGMASSGDRLIVGVWDIEHASGRNTHEIYALTGA